jgi:hypothetical protein
MNKFKDIKEKLLKIKIKLPPLKDILYLVLFLFSISFGVSIYVLGEKLKQSYNTEIANPPSALELKMDKIVADSPIKLMVPLIAQRNEKTAAYLIAIAKKESNWGKYSPKKNGKDCYNYWGYRGDENPTLSGYSCFKSPRQAVSIVGRRIDDLIAQKIDTPREMVIWKCGNDCEGHSSYSVQKWINDVDFYFKKLYSQQM